MVCGQWHYCWRLKIELLSPQFNQSGNWELSQLFFIVSDHDGCCRWEWRVHSSLNTSCARQRKLRESGDRRLLWDGSGLTLRLGFNASHTIFFPCTVPQKCTDLDPSDCVFTDSECSWWLRVSQPVLLCWKGIMEARHSIETATGLVTIAKTFLHLYLPM